VLAIPLDGVGQPGLEVLVLRLPTRARAQLGGVDRIAQVVAGAVGDVVERVRGLAHQGQDQLDDLEVVLLAVRADQVGLADLGPSPGSVSTAEEWSSAWIQSRTFSPEP
jgi:hypothetical protein